MQKLAHMIDDKLLAIYGENSVPDVFVLLGRSSVYIECYNITIQIEYVGGKVYLTTTKVEMPGYTFPVCVAKGSLPKIMDDRLLVKAAVKEYMQIAE